MKKFADVISILIYTENNEDASVLLKNNPYSLPNCESTTGIWIHDTKEFLLSEFLYIQKENAFKMICCLRIFVPSKNTCYNHVTFSIKLQDSDEIKIGNAYKFYSRSEINATMQHTINRKKTLSLINGISRNDSSNSMEVLDELHPILIDNFLNSTNSMCVKVLKTPGYSKKDLTEIYELFVSMSYPFDTVTFSDMKEFLGHCGWKDAEEKAFRALNVNGGELDLKHFLLGMSAMDPLTQHGDVSGEHRCRYIFRMYDENCDKFLDCKEIENMVKDIYKLQSGSFPSDELLSKNLNSALEVFGISKEEKLSQECFLQSVGSLRFRGTSLLFRASNSIPIIIMKLKRRLKGKKRTRSYSESSITEQPNKRTEENRLIADIKVKGESKNMSSVANGLSVKYCLAEHTVKVRRNGNVSNVDNLLDMERAGEVCNTGLEKLEDMDWEEEEVLGNLGVVLDTDKNTQNQEEYMNNTTNYRKKVSKQFSAQAFNIKSLPNEIIIALDYFSRKGKDKERFNWGQVDMMKMGRYLISLCDFIQDLFEQEPRVLNIAPPCYVLGDLHGNYEDLICFEKTLWKLGPHLTPANFLFLGDYVDRGDFGIEVVAYLFAQKLRAPANFHLLRGNHEVRDLQKSFTFYNECLLKFGAVFGEQIWEKVNQVFDRMPLAAVVGQKIFCLHGGIPNLMTGINQLYEIPCPLPNPEEESKIAWQIMWNDPIAATDMTEEVGKQLKENGGFADNIKRQTGFVFNEKAFDSFLEKNNYSHVIRAHEVKQVGFEIQQSGRLFTVFSSSKYCGGSNESACILINDYRIRIIRFETADSC